MKLDSDMIFSPDSALNNQKIGLIASKLALRWGVIVVSKDISLSKVINIGFVLNFIGFESGIIIDVHVNIEKLQNTMEQYIDIWNLGWNFQKRKERKYKQHTQLRLVI